MSGLKRESDRVSRLDLDSGYCFVRRRRARQWRQGAAAPACFIQSASAGRDLRRPPNLLTPLPSPPFAASNYKHDRLYAVTIISITASDCHNRNVRHVRLSQPQLTYT